MRALRTALATGSGGTVYRVAFHRTGPDPRVALRGTLPSLAERERMRARMDRWDDASPSGARTRAVLTLLRDHPGVRAADLAGRVGMDRPRFKANVRKLKGLGLTESLETGYRLSPRGDAFLRHLEAES